MLKVTTCQKVALSLVLSQLIIIIVGYYSHTSVWTVMSHKYMPNGLITGLSSINGHTNETGEIDTSYRTSSAIIDVHIENSDREHGFQHHSLGLTNPHPSTSIYKTSIAIGLGITTRKLKLTGSSLMRLPFFKSLLISFCKTASQGYDYQFYVAYDYNDVYLSKDTFKKEFGKQFVEYTQSKCPKDSGYSLHFVQCSHTGKPAWAQNDAMMEAYMSGIEYFYRINDDSIMKTGKWTEKFIESLDNFIPARLGVVGPKHQGGNMAILTYDFTHRTHVEIHGYYYPREFPDWYGDRWITEVYMPGRSIKRSDVLLIHTMEMSQRYKNTHRSRQEVTGVIAKDRTSVLRYIKMAENGFKTPEGDKVIAMSLVSASAAHSWGVVRNAQLVPVIFPGWSLHVYTSNSSTIPDRVLTTLTSLGAKLFYVEEETSNVVPPSLWHYLAADDPNIQILLLREATHRLTERDSATVTHWLQSDTSQSVHCIKDHTTHTNQTIVNGLWGVKTKALHGLPGYSTMSNLIKEFKSTHQNDIKKPAPLFLHEFLYPIIKGTIICYDSINCDGIGSLPFPVDRTQPVYVGQSFDSHEMPLIDEKLNLLKSRNINCEGLT